jgi:hypothetical protein
VNDSSAPALTIEEHAMRNAKFFRRFADNCRRLLRIVTKPEARQQLRIWERELDEIADALERRKRRRPRTQSFSERARASAE